MEKEELKQDQPDTGNAQQVQSLDASLSEVDALVTQTDEDQGSDQPDYAALDAEQVIEKAGEFLHHQNVNLATEVFKRLKVRMDELAKTDREQQLKDYVAAGNEPREFKPAAFSPNQRFNAVYHQFNERKASERKRAEEEKLANLKAKEAILKRMAELCEAPESEKTREEMNDLQRQWKQIRSVPGEFRQHLWDTYRFYLEKYHDSVSQFHELKELDRRKNLEQKIDLIAKVDSLREDTNIRRALILLNKYHEDFKNTGPVPQEFREDVWNRFKTASDTVLNEKRDLIARSNEQRKNNLQLKTVLCERAEQMILTPPATMKGWNEMADQLKGLFEEWKTIGPVPKENSEDIWNRFRNSQNEFYKLRKEHFRKISADKEENLKRKEALCAEAEKISGWDDFMKGTDQILKLQEKWKAIGPVPEKQSDEVWKRFRAACDAFFARKDSAFKEKRASEGENLKIKEEIIAELRALESSEDAEAAMSSLRALQLRWLQAGMVPRKDFKRIQQEYQDCTDKVLGKFKRSRDEVKASLQKEHYQAIASAPDGGQRLKTEERKLRDRISMLKSDMQTLENNLLFFANSKNADTFKKQFEEKIKISKSQIEKLEAEIRMIRSLAPAHAK